MAELVLIEGPAGGGKSQVAQDLLAAGSVQLIADVTQLWAALSGAVRGPDGRYPVRRDDDPALAVALSIRAYAARRGLELDADVAVTAASRGQAQRWAKLADDVGATLSVRTVDPGREVVTERLAEADGELSGPCARAVGRWYGS